MIARMIQVQWWQFIKRTRAGGDKHPDRWECSRRVRISETDAFSVPVGTRRLRVVSGGAWVSHLREDLILHVGEVLHLMPDREGVIVTAVGHQPLELELYR